MHTRQNHILVTFSQSLDSDNGKKRRISNIRFSSVNGCGSSFADSLQQYRQSTRWQIICSKAAVFLPLSFYFQTPTSLLLLLPAYLLRPAMTAQHLQQQLQSPGLSIRFLDVQSSGLSTRYEGTDPPTRPRVAGTSILLVPVRYQMNQTWR